jgi:hypothetical protein
MKCSFHFSTFLSFLLISSRFPASDKKLFHLKVAPRSERANFPEAAIASVVGKKTLEEGRETEAIMQNNNSF